jgi:hypothetical protein
VSARIEVLQNCRPSFLRIPGIGDDQLTRAAL